jgi:hypothetical protein
VTRVAMLWVAPVRCIQTEEKFDVLIGGSARAISKRMSTTDTHRISQRTVDISQKEVAEFDRV